MCQRIEIASRCIAEPVAVECFSFEDKALRDGDKALDKTSGGARAAADIDLAGTSNIDAEPSPLVARLIGFGVHLPASVLENWE